MNRFSYFTFTFSRMFSLGWDQGKEYNVEVTAGGILAYRDLPRGYR